MRQGVRFVVSLSSKHHAYLKAMGIQTWERYERPRTAAVPGSEQLHLRPDTTPVIPETITSSMPVISDMNWQTLQQSVSSCRACELHNTRNNTVFGVGSATADLMVIGEAPGADEDRQGEPFVGRAGALLNEMLFAIGLQREQIYIANILKCRPPGNRDPQPQEVSRCEPYLHRQIELVQPKLLLAVGRVAAQNLLKTTSSLGQLRGHWHSFGETGIPVLVTYHPAYLLRKPLEKHKAWQDLQIVNHRLEQS